MARKSATRKAADQTAAKQQTRVTVALAVTPEFKVHLETLAQQSSQSVSVFAAMTLRSATQYAGLAVPARAAKRTKYATKEEAKAAQAAKAKERNAKMAKLYKLFLAGKIDASVIAA